MTIGWLLEMMVVQSSMALLPYKFIIVIYFFILSILYVYLWKKLRYWQSNMNNVKVNKTAHKESVRDLRYVMFLNVHKFFGSDVIYIA